MNDFKTLKEIALELRNYLEFHNSPDALEGYFNDIAEEINDDLAFHGIAPITLVDPVSYEVGS